MEMKRSAKGLDGRHRDKSGEIDKKHGRTKVGTLRKTYGPHFAKGHRSDMMLATLLKKSGASSLHQLLRMHPR